MNSLSVLRHIESQGMDLIDTRSLAQTLRISADSAAKYLDTLRENDLVIRLRRGKWVYKKNGTDPLRIAEFLTSPRESYISLQSALFYHGMIEQIPSRIYAVTLDRSKVVNTPIGVYSFHHCNPIFFFGFKYLKPFLNVATAEKALVDYFYFGPGKTRQFTKLPELELPSKFSVSLVREHIERIPSARNRTYVRERLAPLLPKKL